MNLFIDDGPPPAVNSGWNPADKAANITLSGTNNVEAARASGTDQGVRAVQSRNTGKFYFEIHTPSDYASGEVNGIDVGLANASASLTAQYIFGSPGGAWVAWRGNRNYGNDISGFIGAHTAPGWAATSGVNWIGLACDLDAMEVTMYYASGSHGPISYGTTGGGVMFPLLSLGSAMTTTKKITLCLLASEFTGSIPGGYAEWG